MSGQYAAIGGAFLALLIWVLGWLVPKLVGNSIDTRFAKKERSDQEYRKEQVEDALRQMKGQQVIGDCLHEVLRHMITGNHIEDLERVQTELEAFRAENQEALMRKAAKYNLR
jgi:hypothetical protein